MLEINTVLLWLKEHVEWVFSGIGVLLISLVGSAIAKFLKRNRHKVDTTVYIGGADETELKAAIDQFLRSGTYEVNDNITNSLSRHDEKLNVPSNLKEERPYLQYVGSASIEYIKKPLVTVGREPSCDIVIPHPFVSRIHVTIHLEREEYFVLTDKNSINGTYHNSKRINSRVELSDGDTISLGNLDFLFCLPMSIRSTHRRQLEMPMVFC